MALVVCTPFSAIVTAQTVVVANPNRRRLEIWSFGLPEETDTNSVWVNDGGDVAAPFHCRQLIPGAVFQFGGSSDLNQPMRLYFPSCSTSMISVITSAGTHRGLIIEFT